MTATYSITVNETDNFDHDWDDGIITVGATHMTSGVNMYTCMVDNCGATRTEEIPPTDIHNFGNWTKYDDVQHSHPCECGETEYANHNWEDSGIAVEPTYTSTGVATFTCDDCGASKTETIPLLEIPEDAPYIVVDSKNAVIGNLLTVKISLKNNPGITSLAFNIAYDSALLKLRDIEYNAKMGGVRVEYDDRIELINGNVVLYWTDGFENYEGDDVFATLTFEVSENATADTTTNIVATYDKENIYDKNECNVMFFCENSSITFVDYLPGDINGDGVVNTKDTTRLMRYLAGWDVEVNEAALDVNGDGVVNTKDTTRLMRYLANWDVEIC